MSAAFAPLCLGFLLLFIGLAPLRAQERAMWVYRTEALLASQAEQESLLAFCKERRITDLFWQINRDRTQNHAVKHADATRAFLQAAHEQLIRVHALDGDPADTFTRNHDRVLAKVEAVIAFNEAGERFDGLHLDIEPHALKEWKTLVDAEKADWLTQLVTIHGRVAERAQALKPALIYGADIVFWLGKTHSDGSLAYPVTYRGVTKDAAAHLLEVVDNVGIMGYRGSAEGSNGLIAIAAKTVEQADHARGRAYVGVKMAAMGGKDESFYGRTESQMMAELNKVDAAFAGHRGYAGICFFMYEAFRVMPR